MSNSVPRSAMSAGLYSLSRARQLAKPSNMSTQRSPTASSKRFASSTGTSASTDLSAIMATCDRNKESRCSYWFFTLSTWKSNVLCRASNSPDVDFAKSSARGSTRRGERTMKRSCSSVLRLVPSPSDGAMLAMLPKVLSAASMTAPAVLMPKTALRMLPRMPPGSGAFGFGGGAAFAPAPATAARSDVTTGVASAAAAAAGTAPATPVAMASWKTAGVTLIFVAREKNRVMSEPTNSTKSTPKGAHKTNVDVDTLDRTQYGGATSEQHSSPSMMTDPQALSASCEASSRPSRVPSLR
mmetsp:Transcript_71015/g.230544  ORF Transcript_71015/g.230544 Transcript_71015/m.230544 type:complete len:298 (-) Transcript_71015:375-1268(-)